MAQRPQGVPLRQVPPEPLAVYTAEEAADILRVKKSWLEKQAAARRIPFTMLGGSYRFSDKHLAEIVRLNERAPAKTGTIPIPRTKRPHRSHPQRKPGRPDVVPLQPRPREVKRGRNTA